MAKRRMISLNIVDTDLFARMSQNARYLYFELLIRADDDGFIGAPMRIVGMVGCIKNDLKELIDNNLVIEFETGIIVIKDWKIHNKVRSDMYKPTLYQEEYGLLHEINKRYYLKTDNVTKNVTENVTENVTKDVTLGKDSIGKDNINNIYCASDNAPKTEIDDFFETIWKLYPVKKGKGQVSKTKKGVLFRIGYEQIKRCVDRFIADMQQQQRDTKYWMHGSTFFNSGYVDYLDENYQDSGQTTDESIIQAQRQRDYEKNRAELREMLGGNLTIHPDDPFQ